LVFNVWGEKTMRLDKFLQVSRLIKRRTVAKDACDGGKISVNQRTAKAGTEIAPGDMIRISYGNKVTIVKVIATPAAVGADKAHETYELVSEIRKEDV
jgi:ribosomal 50S subunit-recycling heat shock protein